MPEDWPKLRTRLFSEVRIDIARRRDAGESAAKIAQEYGISTRAVYANHALWRLGGDAALQKGHETERRVEAETLALLDDGTIRKNLWRRMERRLDVAEDQVRHLHLTVQELQDKIDKVGRTAQWLEAIAEAAQVALVESAPKSVRGRKTARSRRRPVYFLALYGSRGVKPEYRRFAAANDELAIEHALGLYGERKAGITHAVLKNAARNVVWDSRTLTTSGERNFNLGSAAPT